MVRTGRLALKGRNHGIRQHSRHHVPKAGLCREDLGRTRKLETEFGYEIPDGLVGECWSISAHPNGDCVIEGGAWNGRYLSDLWTNEPQLFGGAKDDRFPLLIKILDAHDYLSVQVHPDDAYASEHENGSLGKSECWYILEADPDARIMIGQKAHDRDELAAMVREHRWSELLNEIPIHGGRLLRHQSWYRSQL